MPVKLEHDRILRNIQNDYKNILAHYDKISNIVQSIKKPSDLVNIKNILPRQTIKNIHKRSLMRAIKTNEFLTSGNAKPEDIDNLKLRLEKNEELKKISKKLLNYFDKIEEVSKSFS